MKVTKEKIENSQAFLTIEMEPAEVEESMEKSYRRLVGRAEIPGFRKGKAPRAILERYLGRERLLEDALNDLLPQACEKAISEQEIEAIARPEVELIQTDPVVFKAVVPMRPKVKLGDYQHIQVVPQPVELAEGDVNAVIEQLRHQHATWEPVEHSVNFGDLVVLDIDSKLEGKPFINRQGAQYQVLPDLPFPAPGFAEQLVDLKRNEEKEFQLQFPSDYPQGELAGKEFSFKVKVNEIKQEILPELNDEFAKEINPDFKTLDSLREQASSDLKRRAEEKARMDFEEQAVEATIGLTEVEFPPVLVEVEINHLLNQRFQRGSQELEEYLRSINKTEEELREELRPLATKRVTRSLVLDKIAEEEKIEVGGAEVEAEVESITKGATDDRKDELKKALDTPQARKSIEQILITRKTIQRLAEIAKNSAETKIIQKEGK